MTTQMSQTATPPATVPESTTPKIHLRVLIISGKYHIFSFDPETTVGRAKELIWSMWPSEWTEPAQPPAPSWMKVLYSGRVLADDSTLLSNNIPISSSNNNPTVVHLSVRSFSVDETEDDKKHGAIKRTTTRSSNRPAHAEEEVGGCKCVIQ
ncbi:uncharacterized protein CcaverHIS019_0106140 [Cutaneotrichosporon cavernicola]|uniref:Ubiquitin-like domain-containing protein n=1 Tax=Cutaneotrichosporon cavernicola TaxID=279322 RepID=A0AA48HYM4_9TREE|nr:uncharacterized protein CcaverHIS019_0106140 [Cutaneotrichosporon cavernicola]BEI87896.1 hypothetical protein CcaverHIS019_0106140 [Cutaneotrichosporon cavernicola]BEI95670.1 hypothetical protein CcaverHIS631_0106190 [Cutaneotrichosporon cavernicola]BEJ03444.1 hypothetical protein CcaverHIS641_0106190 [Cutaneotrichosporon cavernicola]